MKTTKRMLAVVFCAVFAVGAASGCKRTTTITDVISGSAGGTQVVAGESGSAGESADASSSEGKANTEETAPTSAHNQSAGELVVDNAGTDPNADYSVSGTVTIAVDTARATDYEALFDSMKSVYKNLTIKFDYFAHGSNDNAAEYLSTRAASGKMPDVVWDEAGNLPLYLTQGWVYPLDSFVKDDPDFQYVPDNLVQDYTYGGKLYALPHQAHFELMFLNLDVLNALNLSMPSLSWTTDDFASYLKKASTDKYSGMEKLFQIPTLLTNAFNSSTTQYGYNPTTRQLDVSGFTDAVKYMVQLRAVPNLEAWALRRTTTGGKSDYVIKFGSNDDNTAFNKGLTLFHGVGTWELADAKDRWSGMNWTIWTIPQSASNPGSMPMHVDHCFMTSSAQNADAAFQVLRYITYSTEGNLARLSMYDSANAGKYVTNNYLYYPTTTNPQVAAKFKALPGVTEVDKYLFDNIGNSMRYDMNKLVPSWSDVVSNNISSAVNEATDGTVTNVASILNEMATKANAAFKQAWSDFETKLSTVQAEFSSTHPGT